MVQSVREGDGCVKIYVRFYMGAGHKDDCTGTWRLDGTANFVEYHKKLKALTTMAEVSEKTKKKGEVSPFREVLPLGPLGGGNVEDAAANYPGERQSTWSAMSIPVYKKTEMDYSHLNEAQRTAVNAAAFRRLTLIQGPPGTGKTLVCSELIKTWIAMGIKPILVTAHNHVAVDNVAELLLKKEMNVIRIGSLDQVSAALEKIAYDLYAKNTRVPNADVMCITNISSCTPFLKAVDFKAILMDEAAQATEPSALIPITSRFQAKQLVLVGDQCQLPATVNSFEAMRRGYSLSLFERLLRNGVEPYFLDTQYRMHPAIAAHSSENFYRGALKTGISPEERKPPRGFQWPIADAGMALLDSGTCNEERDDAESYFNIQEANAVLQILRGVVNKGELAAADIGIVTPYAGQVRFLQQLVKKANLHGSKSLEIASVDSFQGREKELIIFSAVRSNDRARIGFVADRRRLNVMLTRARRGLIVLGDIACLKKNKEWLAFIQRADREGFKMDHAHFRRFAECSQRV